MATRTFLTATRDYLDAMRPYLSQGTLARKWRNLRTTYRDLEALGLARRPAQIEESDVEALLLRWKTRPPRWRGASLDRSTQAKYLSDLEGFLDWCGNPVVSNLRRKRRRLLPRPTSKPIVPLSEDDLDRLRRSAEMLEGWRGVVARFLIAFLPYTGLRPKEFRLARLQDLDLANWRILVAHPKGEDTWAVADFAPILGPAHEALREFLAERETYLAGEESDWLVPYRCPGGALGPWDDSVLLKLKSELAERGGVRFSLKTFRTTFAQLAKDRGASIEAVSKALRHKTTKTTEAYYARIRADDAFADLERAFERPIVKVE